MRRFKRIRGCLQCCHRRKASKFTVCTAPWENPILAAKSDLTFQQVAKILGVEQAFRIAGLAAFLERIYGWLARVNALLGDIAQKLLVERRRMGIQGGVGRVVETEHLAVVRQAAHMREELQQFVDILRALRW